MRTSMTTQTAITCGAVLAAAALAAQTMPPNAAGVFAAHTHLITTDLSASTGFWTAVGGAPAQIGTMNGVRMPGLYVMFQSNRGRGTGANAAPAAPPPPPESSVGSVVEAIGITVKDMKTTLARLAALGVKPETGASDGPASVLSPERVKVLLTEDPSIAAGSKANEWLMRVPSPGDAAAWYQKWFGASIVARG